MSASSRFLAGASALALATGAALAGAGVAAAEDAADGTTTGSLSSSSLDLGGTAADLELAAAALNGPVTVDANAEGGPTVTFTNDLEVDAVCTGFTMPYTTISELGINPADLDGGIASGLGLVNQIDREGGTSVLTVDADGEPDAYDSVPGGSPLLPSTKNIARAFTQLMLGEGLDVSQGETVEWVATRPEDPAAAVVACSPVDDGEMAIAFGIDPAIVANQLGDTLGSVGGSVDAGPISGGSVETGATVLGSLASGSAGDGDEDAEDAGTED